MIIYYGRITTTVGEDYLLGYDPEDPSTGNVIIMPLEKFKYDENVELTASRPQIRV